MTQTLGREQRLKSQKTIDDIFQKRNSVSKYPIRLLWKELTDGSTNSQCAFLFLNATLNTPQTATVSNA